MTIAEQAYSPLRSIWPGEDDRGVVTQMLRDRHSPHWHHCSRFVDKQVQKQSRASSVLREPTLKNDVVQNSMEAVMKALPNFRFHCRLTTWLTTIVRSSIIDAARKELTRQKREAVSLDTLNLYGDSGNGIEEIIAPQTTESVCLLREELD